MLGGAVDLGDRSLHAEAAVTAVDAGWRLDLRLTGSHAEGARAIESASCEELADAAALVIAIAIDPERMMTAASATPPPDVPPPAVPEPTPPAPKTAPKDMQEGPAPDPSQDEPPREEPATTPRAHAINGAVRILAGVGLGALPAPAAILGADIGLLGRRYRIDLGVLGWFPRTAESANNAAVGGRFSLVAARVRGCGVPGAFALSFPLCVGVDVGAMRGTGIGALAVSRSATAPWAAARASAGLLWSWRLLGLWIEADALLAFARPIFGTTESPELYRPGLLSACFSGGIEVRFR
ncbi:MAG: hypothetical protein R3A51_07820 [Nannocystaceae bacterium]